MSALRCRVGDIAVIVRSAAGNEGKIVQCLRLEPNYLYWHRNGTLCSDVAWETDTDLATWGGGTSRMIADRKLRPLRNGDAADETLAWKAVPKTDKVLA